MKKTELLTRRRDEKEYTEDTERYPYIHVERHIEMKNTYYSFWGARVVALIDKSYLSEVKMADLFNEHIKFVNCLLESRPAQTIELRYIVNPDREDWTKGKLEIVLMGRNVASSRAEARLSAMKMWNNIVPVLAIEADHVEFKMIREREDFLSSWMPFEVKDIVEITCREEMVKVDKNLLIYNHYHFIPNMGTLSRLCKGLLARKEPLIYSISLKPVVLTEVEKNYMGNPFQKVSGFMPLDIKHQDQEDHAYHGSGCSTKAAYHLKMHVTSACDILSSTVDLIGSECTYPPRCTDVNVYGDGDRKHKGGYAWHRPLNAETFKIAVNNIRYQEFETWAPTLSPKGLERLRYIFSPEEASAVFRLPVTTEKNDLPGLKIKNNLPLMSPKFAENGLLVGMSRFGDITTEVRLAAPERRKHCYIQGATGTGKTTLIMNMALQDIWEGRGVMVMDFHGDLSDELLKRLPPERLDDLIYFNPADTKYPIGFNPMAYDPASPLKELAKENIVSAILSWLKKEYNSDTMGPAFYQNVRNALLLAMADDSESATIMDLVNIFFDKEFLKRKLAKLNSPIAKRFWLDVYDSTRYNKSGDNGITMLQYITCKFSPFIDSELSRNIFCQRVTGLNFRRIMDSKKILVCNFSKGLIGETNADFLALMTLSKIEQAAFSRIDIPEEERADFYVYLDECQNLQTEYFYNLLSEMRKYRVNLTLANQHFSQLNEKMRDAIVSNCGTVFIFKTGVKDAEALEPMLYPYNKRLIVNLSNYQAVARMPVTGELKSFTLETLPLQMQEYPLLRKAAIEKSRKKYSVNRETVWVR